jgi:hypothetical protein
MSQVAATGGDTVEDIQVGTKFYRVHKFTTPGLGTLTISEGGEVEVLVVGGGGGGGANLGGGGGGGGFVSGTFSVAPGPRNVFVGSGGNGGTRTDDAGVVTETASTPGVDSFIFNITAVGGGRGGGRSGTGADGGPGGSGGGGAGDFGSTLPADALGGLGTAGQGNDGGKGLKADRSGGGGGGGASQAGADGASGGLRPAGGKGGNGLASAITGTSVTYAGGGGGGGGTGGAAGTGGGGAGGVFTTGDFGVSNGANGTNGLGGGGGGGGQGPGSRVGGNGGSGIVIVRYEISGFLAEVTTGTATEITKTTARLSGEVTDDGDLTTTRGIAVATGPTFNQTFLTIFAEGFGVGTYDIEFSGLSASTTYHFRAFAINAAGTAFGDWVTFTTEAGSPPTAETGFASAVSYQRATLSGSVTEEGEGEVTERGIAVGPRPEPVPGQPDVINLAAGSGLGSFNRTVTGLQPDTLYYFRAYGRNDEAGTGFGDDETFETLVAEPPTSLTLTMPEVDEDTVPSAGAAQFQTDPMETGTYTWQVSAQLEPPYTGATSAVLTGQGVTAGTVSVVGQGATGSISFQPAANWFGTVSFSYRVSNGFAFSDWEQATVTVRPVADPPGPVVGEFPNLDEDTTAEFDLTWADVDDLPAGTLVASPNYFLQMRPTAGGPWRWLTEGSPTARLTNVVVRVLNYSNAELRGTFRVEPDANYYGPYGAQVRVAKKLEDDTYLFGPARNLAGVIASVPDTPTRPQPNRMPTAKIGQTVFGRFTTFDPDIEDTSWTFEIAPATTEDIPPFVYPAATGGDETFEIEESGKTYRVHKFTAVGSANLTVTSGGEIEYLIVAGGGGGGSRSGGGGGGAGGLLTGTFTPQSGPILVVVGAGGAGGTTSGAQTGQKGSDSILGSIVAAGGGGGGLRGGGTAQAGGDGGSGGGGGQNTGNSATVPGGTATPAGQGNNGGSGFGPANAAGGGGGATGAGGNAGTGTKGARGDGLTSAFDGTSRLYAQGGEGALTSSAADSGGRGGGNEATPINRAGRPGAANTGGGGGGGGSNDNTGAGGSGGSGIVVVRYVINDPALETSDWGTSLVIPDVGTLTVVDDDPSDQETLVRLVQEPGGATDLRYSFALRVTDSSGLISPVQRVTGLITLPTATVFLQKVTRNSPAVVTPLTPLVEVFDLNVTDSIDGIGGADVTVSTDEVRRRAAQLGITAAELLEPGTVELVVAIGTQLVFVGPIGEIEWSATRDRITIDARGLLSYLEERRIGTGTTSFVGEDIADIMWMLVDDAQGQSFGDYAFTDNTTTAGTNLTVEFEPRTRILEALRSLSQADGGPDFWIDPERRLNTAAARGQDRRDIIRLTPAMMEAATWTNRDEQLATVVTVIGGEDGMGGFFQGTAVTTDSAALAKYGRRERLIEQRELTSDQQCEDYAARVVAEQARRSETIRLDIIVTPGRPFSIRDLEVGDIVTVDLRAPDLGQVIGAYRVVNRRLNLVSETADSYRVRLDLVPAPFINSALVKVKARHNASIVERLAQLGSQQE